MQITTTDVVLMGVNTLGEFLLEEMRKRQMSMREFGDLVGVAHTTISKFASHDLKDVGYPSLDFLLKLAKGTNTDICYIMMLIDPDAVQSNIDPRIMALSREIGKLPDNLRDAIDAIILGVARSKGDEQG